MHDLGSTIMHNPFHSSDCTIMRMRKPYAAESCAASTKLVYMCIRHPCAYADGEAYIYIASYNVPALPRLHAKLDSIKHQKLSERIVCGPPVPLKMAVR